MTLRATRPDPALHQALPEITQRLTRAAAEQHAPALAVGIVRDQELAWFAGYGRPRLDLDQSPTADTLFRVASITKTFTVAALLQLRDAGRLSLDDPLQRHLPEFAAAQERGGPVAGVTLARLASHHSGLATEAPLPSWDGFNFPTREALLAALPRVEVTIPQDSAFKYSNLAFGLLGEVVARVSGRPYAEYVLTEILEPLGMTASVFDLAAANNPYCAIGYMPDLFQDAVAPAPIAHLGALEACGQLHSTTADLAKWISLQFRSGASNATPAAILQPATLEEFHRPRYLEPDWSSGYCLGWRVTRIGNRVYHGHGGGLPGFASYIAFSKTGRSGVICLANMWPHPGLLNLATDVLESLHKADVATLSAGCASSPPPQTPAHFRRLLGLYQAALGIPAQIEFKGGLLRLAKSPLADYVLHAPALLEQTSDPTLFVVRGGRCSGERAEFEFDAAGAVLGFKLGGFVYRKLEPR